MLNERSHCNIGFDWDRKPVALSCLKQKCSMFDKNVFYGNTDECFDDEACKK